MRRLVFLEETKTAAKKPYKSTWVYLLNKLGEYSVKTGDLEAQKHSSLLQLWEKMDKQTFCKNPTSRLTNVLILIHKAILIFVYVF